METEKRKRDECGDGGVRYADDLVILSDYKLRTAEKVLTDKLQELGLKLKAEKTRQLNANTGDFDFLGYNFRRRWNPEKQKRLSFMQASQKSQMKVKAKIREITRKRPVKVTDVIEELNPVLRGWTNYFRLGKTSDVYNKIRCYANSRVRRFMRRNQGRHGYGRNTIKNEFLHGTLNLYYIHKFESALT